MSLFQVHLSNGMDQNEDFIDNRTLQLIFDLVIDGDSEGLKNIFRNASAQFTTAYLSMQSRTGETPLICAARSGHARVVQLFLEYGADPESTGTVIFDGERITQVPPLWAASAAGHLDVCKILVFHGVDVNKTTNTNSTPLRGACYDGHLSVVKFLVENGADIEIANRHGHTALMIAAYREQAEVVNYLLSIGALTDRRSVKGNTVLHDAAESGNVEIMKLLLDRGTKIQADDFDVTPIISAAMCGNSEVVELLFPLSQDKVERHNALKLLGASFVDKQVDMGKAITYWKRSFDPAEIELTTNGNNIQGTSTYLGAFDFIPEFNAAQEATYGNYKEIRSLRDVDRLVGDPEAIRMQALIIRERVLGDSHPDAHFYLRYRGACYLEIGNWERCWNLWIYLLQLEQHYLLPLSLATASTFFAFVEAFNLMMDDLIRRPESRRHANHNRFPTVGQVVTILDRAIYELEKFMFSDDSVRKEHLLSLFECTGTFKQELDNLYSVILQLIQLINRINFLNSPVYRNSSDLVVRNVAPDNEQMHRPGSHASGSSYTAPSLAAPQRRSLEAFTPTFRNSVFLNQSASNRGISQSNPEHRATFNYCTANVAKMCSSAYLMKSLQTRHKYEPNPLPLCSHLKCLLHRLIKISDEIDPLTSILHRAVNENYPDSRRIISVYVVEKLLQAGADLRKVDENENTPLHILLSNKDVKPGVVKLMLEAYAPLLARNISNETCLDLIRKSSVLNTYVKPIGYLTLKQIAANTIMRNLSGSDTFENILPSDLEKFINIF